MPYESWNSASLRILSKLRAEEGLTQAVTSRSKSTRTGYGAWKQICDRG